MLETYTSAHLLGLKISILRVLRKHLNNKFWGMDKMLEDNVEQSNSCNLMKGGLHKVIISTLEITCIKSPGTIKWIRK